MKLSKKKEMFNSKLLSIIILILFFGAYILIVPCIFSPEYNIIDTIETLFVIMNALLINRYIGVGLSIYSYIKYKDKLSLIIMTILIILQIVSIIALIYWGSTVDFDIDG